MGVLEKIHCQLMKLFLLVLDRGGYIVLKVVHCSVAINPCNFIESLDEFSY